ncbi:MAG TPA: CHAT domain-containing protein [Leptolyngbyaceae cyanobacterium]
MSRFLRRLLRWHLLFLVGLLLGLLVNVRGWALQVKQSDPAVISQSVSLSQLAQQGESFYEAGKFTEAIAFWQQALARTSSPREKAVIYNNLATAFRQIGQVERAIDHWQKAIEIYQQANDRDSRSQLAKLLTEQAQAYSELGQHRRGIKILQSALEITQKNQERLTEIAVLGALGNAYWALGDYEQAISNHQNSLKIARELSTGNDGNDRADRSSLITTYIQNALNNLGNVYTKRAERYRYQAQVAQLEGDKSEETRLLNLAKQDIATAIESFQQSIETGASEISTVQALLNMNRLMERNKNVNSAKITGENSETIDRNRQQALQLLSQMPDSRDKAYGLINLSASSDAQKAVRLLADAIAVSRNIGDIRAESFALGSLAQLYENSHQYKEATELNRQALFAAQKVNAVDSLYRWQWQAGRILKASGEINKAISYYDQAIASLQSIRSDILAANKDFQFDFRDSVEPVYRQMMGLLLEESSNREVANQNLSKVLDILELLKLAELQNFFGDECVQVAKDNVNNNGKIADDRATIIYSVILENRTETIVRSPDGKLIGYPLAIGQAELQQEIDSLRLLLENRATDEYLPQAQKIYDWLIRPMEKDLALAKPKTLVFINDGVLRKVPMAALHDGKEFLIQKYAIATTPSLNLTASQSLNRRNLQALSVGLTVERPPFAPLTNVANEVAEVQKILGGTKLLDRDFTLARLETELRQNNFPIIHMATHGKFGVDAANTFLLGYDSRISIDQIDNLLRISGQNNRANRQNAVELLTLSACQTAAGDNRAALGIAGIAVRAGVKSALASLWFINDEATVPMIEEFYNQLRQPDMTKALALQKAQQKLIASEDYSHPAVWSPFILIGNWF